MVTGKPAWEDRGTKTLARIGLSGELPWFPTQLSETGRDFLNRCLSRDPKERWISLPQVAVVGSQSSGKHLTGVAGVTEKASLETRTLGEPGSENRSRVRFVPIQAVDVGSGRTGKAPEVHPAEQIVWSNEYCCDTLPFGAASPGRGRNRIFSGRIPAVN